MVSGPRAEDEEHLLRAAEISLGRRVSTPL